jgi:hypothetical protein
MAISPIQRQRSDPGLAASIARSALQTVLGEQDARSGVIARAQQINQQNLRRQDQVFRDVQQGYFENRQFAADEEQRSFRNEILQQEEDRAAQKFEADMNLRSQIDPLKVKYFGQSRSGGSSGGSGGSTSSLGAASSPGVSGGQHAQVEADFNTKFAEAPYVPAFGGQPAQGTPPGAQPGPLAEPASQGGAPPPVPGIPSAIPRGPSPGSAGAPDQVLPVSPYQKLGQAEQSAKEAAAEIQQAAIAEREAEIAPDEQQMAAIYFAEPGEQRDTALEYYTAYNKAEAFKAERAVAEEKKTREHVVKSAENYAANTWTEADDEIINNLTDKQRIDYQQAYVSAAQSTARRIKGKDLSGDQISDIRKSWRMPDPEKVKAEAAGVNAVVAAKGLTEQLQAAESDAQEILAMRAAAENDAFGATENERADAIEAVYQSAKKQLFIPDPTSIQEAIDALVGTEKFRDKDGKYVVGAGKSKGAMGGGGTGLSVANAKLLNGAQRVVDQAREAGLLLPNGQIKESAYFGAQQKTPLGQPAAAAPAAAPNKGPVGAPGSGDVRNLLGTRAGLTR